MEQGRADIGYATIVQLYKSLHQYVLDKGNWKAAWLLSLLEDPYGSDSFGGDDDELAVIGGKLRADMDLWEKVHKGPQAHMGQWNDHHNTDDLDDPDAAPNNAPGGKRRARPPKKP